jgi:hypothetical protein
MNRRPLLFVIPTGAKRRGGICGVPFGCPATSGFSAHVALDTVACGLSLKERRMKFVNAIKFTQEIRGAAEGLRFHEHSWKPGMTKGRMVFSMRIRR